jgi:hypothetical protein
LLFPLLLNQKGQHANGCNQRSTADLRMGFFTKVCCNCTFICLIESKPS